MLADKQVNEAVLLYQVLVSKTKTEDSWELGSWRGTTIRVCPPELDTSLCLGMDIFNVYIIRCVCVCVHIVTMIKICSTCGVAFSNP